MNTKEIVTNHCHVLESGMPLRYINQYLFDFNNEPARRDNHFVSYTPDDDEKNNRSLVAIFKITKLNQNARTNL